MPKLLVRSLPAIFLMLLAATPYSIPTWNGTWRSLLQTRRNVLHGEFIWDDKDIYVVNNQVLRAPDGLRRFWFSTEPLDYYPLAYTTFWFEWRLWGLDTFGYHVDNVVLHIACTLLLWRILRRLELPGAWLAAAIFAAHPVHVETVAWIAQRKSLLGAVFAFAAFLCYLHFDGSRRRGWYCAALCLFALALAGKPTMVGLPLLLLGLAWWRRGRVDRQDLQRSLPFFGLVVLFGAVGWWFQQYRAIAEDAIHTPILTRLLAAGWVAWFYIGKTLWPASLTFVYPRWQIDPAVPFSYLPDLALIAVLAAAWHFRHDWGRPLLAGLGYFLISVAPALGFVDVYYWRYSLVGDHYQYQSTIGVIALVVGSVTSVVRGWPERARYPAYGAAALPIAILWLLAWRQAALYRFEEALWRDSIRKNPTGWLPRNNLANLLLERGQVDEAVSLLDEVIRSFPDHGPVQYNLGKALALRGEVDEAIRHYRHAIRLEPKFSGAYLNLGRLLADRGEVQAAIALYRQALELKPNDPQIHNNLGSAFFTLQDFAGAEREWLTAIELEPALAEARNNLGALLIQKQRHADAIAQCSAAAELRPDDPHIQRNLGLALQLAGRSAEAANHFAQAAAGLPNDPTVRLQNGQISLELELPRQALAELQAAVRLKPDWPAAVLALAWLQAIHSDDSVHDPAAAVALIEPFCKAGSKNPEAWDIYAAGLAGMERFTDAVIAAQQAEKLAGAAGQAKTAENIAARIKLYQAQRTFRASRR